MKTIELSISDKNKSLLTHLQENREFLPAYCAGRGTCGKCKVQFLNNIPAHTTHDAAFFSAKELSEGWRLACQAYVKGQFTIQIEDYEEDQIQAASALICRQINLFQISLLRRILSLTLHLNLPQFNTSQCSHLQKNLIRKLLLLHLHPLITKFPVMIFLLSLLISELQLLPPTSLIQSKKKYYRA